MSGGVSRGGLVRRCAPVIVLFGVSAQGCVCSLCGVLVCVWYIPFPCANVTEWVEDARMTFFYKTNTAARRKLQPAARARPTSTHETCDTHTAHMWGPMGVLRNTTTQLHNCGTDPGCSHWGRGGGGAVPFLRHTVFVYTTHTGARHDSHSHVTSWRWNRYRLLTRPLLRKLRRCG